MKKLFKKFKKALLEHDRHLEFYKALFPALLIVAAVKYLFINLNETVFTITVAIIIFATPILFVKLLIEYVYWVVTGKKVANCDDGTVIAGVVFLAFVGVFSIMFTIYCYSEELANGLTTIENLFKMYQNWLN